MTPDRSPGLDSNQPSTAGADLRQRVESLGGALADKISGALATLPERTSGPQALGRYLGITTVTASRLLKALSQSDPIATLQLMPGPNPLRQVVDAARSKGAEKKACADAQGRITEFEDLIRTEAGDRGALKAMLSAWLPEERREFEAQRRQSMFKALAELDGVSSELELNGLILFPSADERLLDIVNVKGLLGIDRIRPDAVVKLGTRRLGPRDEPRQDSALDPERPRVPLNLDGEPALDGLHTVRLDEFCAAPPAPLEAREFGPSVQYSLGPTGFGPASKVDLLLAEVNRGELEERPPNAERPPYFFTIPEMPTRKLVFDLLVHRDVYAGSVPTLRVYDTAAMGPAVAGDPARDLDRRELPEPIKALGSGLRRLRLVEFPTYLGLLEHVFSRLGQSADDFRCYRFAISYPLVGAQVTFAFEGGED